MKYESFREWWTHNKPTPFRVRCWLLKLIAGRMCVVINYSMHAPLILPKDRKAFVCGCSFSLEQAPDMPVGLMVRAVSEDAIPFTWGAQETRH